MLLLLTACAFGPGQGFGELTEATVSAGYEAEGETLTDAGYAIGLERLELELGELVLVAHPEEEVADEHAHAHGHEEPEPAEQAESIVATLPIEAVADLLTGASYSLDVSEHAFLPAGEIGEVELHVHHLAAEGFVRREPDDGWSSPVIVDLELDLPLVAELELPLDRDHPPAIALDVALTVGALFDELDFAALEGETGVAIASHSEPAEHIEEALAATAPVATVTR